MKCNNTFFRHILDISNQPCNPNSKATLSIIKQRLLLSSFLSLTVTIIVLFQNSSSLVSLVSLLLFLLLWGTFLDLDKLQSEATVPPNNNQDRDGLTKNLALTPKRACTPTSTTSTTTTTTNNMDLLEFSDKNPVDDIVLEENPSRVVNEMSREEMRSLLIKEAGFDPDAEQPTKCKKRLDYINWDDFFFGIAVLSSLRSKNPVKPCGACIVDNENRVVGIGYDGLPLGCPDECFPFHPYASNNDAATTAEGVIPYLHTQTPYVCHAEKNAILNKCSADLDGCRIYVERLPCHECAQVIIQSRIKEVIYMEDPEDNNSYRASRILLAMAGVATRKYTPTVPFIDLHFISALAPTTTEVELQSSTNNQLARGVDSCGDEAVYGSTTTISDCARDPPTSNKERFRDLMVREAGYDPVTTPSSHRKDCISWDDYFLAMAFLTAKRSKDPNTQVGAVIVGTHQRILALGYNGFPRGCCDDVLPWAREGESELHKKYVYVCHAEVNAVLNKSSADVKGATLYVALFPCNECAKVIIQAGIREVVFMSDQYHDTDACRASRIMFSMAGVRLRKHIPSFQTLRLRLNNDLPAFDTTTDETVGE